MADGVNISVGEYRAREAEKYRTAADGLIAIHILGYSQTEIENPEATGSQVEFVTAPDADRSEVFAEADVLIGIMSDILPGLSYIRRMTRVEAALRAGDLEDGTPPAVN